MNAYTVSRLALDAGVSMHIVRDYLLRGSACLPFRFLRRPLLALGHFMDGVSSHSFFVVVLIPVQGFFGFAFSGLAFLCRRRHLLDFVDGVATNPLQVVVLLPVPVLLQIALLLHIGSRGLALLLQFVEGVSADASTVSSGPRFAL